MGKDYMDPLWEIKSLPWIGRNCSYVDAHTGALFGEGRK